MPLEIVAIDHVQIAVPRAREAECLLFYRNVLGLAEIEKPPASRTHGGAWFEVGPVQLHVGVDADPSPKSKRHVCFLVGSLEKARAELGAHGIVVEEGSSTEGARRLFIRDPANNRIEIAQRQAC
jgi:catechol 2,3-dioxygenase-like lactoylglutathione lyase family enzyme